MTEVENLNKWLETQGKNLRGEPLYRIVWSDKMYEKRYGRYNDYYGDIFIRTFVGVREVLKYNYISERWILERYISPELSHNKELVDSQYGTYEPLFVFESAKGKYLAPNFKVIQFIMNFINRPKGPIAEDDADRKTYSMMMDYLNDRTDTQIALHFKEGVGYSKEIKDARDY